ESSPLEAPHCRPRAVVLLNLAPGRSKVRLEPRSELPKRSHPAVHPMSNNPTKEVFPSFSFSSRDEIEVLRSPRYSKFFDRNIDSPIMLLDTIVTGLLMAASAAAIPIENPMELIKRAPSAGVVIQKCAKPGVFALAYDDGPYQYTSQLVDILNNGGAKATFFMTGTLYGCIYNQRTAVKKAFDSGHQIASHTWTHPSTFGSLTTAQLTTEMQKLEQAMVNIIGKKPAYMRPPYLATGGSVLSTMKTLGYKVITDDVDSGDWNGQTPAQSEAKFTAAGASGNGHIPLMHETYATTVQTLTPWLINWAKQNNLKLVTVAECLDDASGAYQSGSFTGNGATTC
ncbi:polysaccharide deacetylase, partial [Colletotrichum lupini]